MAMSKNKIIGEIIIVYIFFWVFGFLINHSSLPINGNLLIVLSYFIQILVIAFCVFKIDKESIQSIGIKHIHITDFIIGVALGILLYFIQVLPPILFMNMDISVFGNQPDFSFLILRFLFLIVTVGLGEELVYRGFFLNRLNQVIPSKVIIIILNALMFYGMHLTESFTFNWTHVYSTFVTTFLFCTYFYLSKKRSIIPLIIAHALFDVLIGAPGFSILNMLFK